MGYTGFDLAWPGATSVVILLFCRISGVVLIAPLFSARALPSQWRVAFMILFTMLMAPVGYHWAHTATAILAPSTVLAETALGIAMGIGAGVVVAGAETAGEIMAIQTGLSGGQLLNPMSGVGTAALGTFMNMAVVTLMLTLNIHVLILEALASSLRNVPLGAVVHLQQGLWGMMGVGASMFSVGLRMAAPVLCVVLVVNSALAVLSRAAPSLNILALAFPIQILVGLFAMATSWPYLAVYVRDWPGMWDHQLSTIFTLFR